MNQWEHEELLFTDLLVQLWTKGEHRLLIWRSLSWQLSVSPVSPVFFVMFLSLMSHIAKLSVFSLSWFLIVLFWQFDVCHPAHPVRFTTCLITSWCGSPVSRCLSLLVYISFVPLPLFSGINLGLTWTYLRNSSHKLQRNWNYLEIGICNNIYIVCIQLYITSCYVKSKTVNAQTEENVCSF